MSEYLSKENEVIYNQAMADGYIMMFWSERKNDSNDESCKNARYT